MFLVASFFSGQGNPLSQIIHLPRKKKEMRWCATAQVVNGGTFETHLSLSHWATLVSVSQQGSKNGSRALSGWGRGEGLCSFHSASAQAAVYHNIYLWMTCQKKWSR